jgi:haloalkane dehalogenase
MKKHRQIDISPFRHLYPFKSNYFSASGLKYHFVDEGTGDPVVMIHGNPTWSFYFRRLIKELSTQYRTIAPDHIGCGLSDKPAVNRYDYRLKSRINDLEAFLDYLGVTDRITLVLHDWGGAIGMAYAVRYPHRISRIVIMNTAAFLPPGGKKLPLRLWLIRNLRPFAAPAVLGFNLFSYGALFMASHKGLARDVKSGLTAPYNCWHNRIATLKFVQDIPLEESDYSYCLVKHVDSSLHKLIGIPMLICWGKHDFVFDDTYFTEWQHRFPRAEIHTIPDAGHYVLEDAPDKVVPLIKDFLKRHPI